MKVNIIPRIVNKLRRCIAIVEDGDTCSISGGITSGKWIIWKGGLYQTSEPISYGSSFAVGTNLIAKDGGIGNQLQTQISELDSNSKKIFLRLSTTNSSVGDHIVNVPKESLGCSDCTDYMWFISHFNSWTWEDLPFIGAVDAGYVRIRMWHLNGVSASSVTLKSTFTNADLQDLLLCGIKKP